MLPLTETQLFFASSPLCPSSLVSRSFPIISSQSTGYYLGVNGDGDLNKFLLSLCLFFFLISQSRQGGRKAEAHKEEIEISLSHRISFFVNSSQLPLQSPTFSCCRRRFRGGREEKVGRRRSMGAGEIWKNFAKNVGWRGRAGGRTGVESIDYFPMACELIEKVFPPLAFIETQFGRCKRENLLKRLSSPLMLRRCRDKTANGLRRRCATTTESVYCFYFLFASICFVTFLSFLCLCWH